MFEFLIRKSVIRGAQKFINKLQPAVNVHIPPDLPLPSVGIIKKMCVTVAKINGMEVEMKELADEQLRAKTTEFKERLKADANLDAILPEAFAVVREAGRRVLNMRHFDVQLIGGMALNKGMIAEMVTGEGKTLVATLAAYLNALNGQGVHVITVNDYLAQRDRDWMGPLFEFLGLSVGVIQHDMGAKERQDNYACDITYGTNNEFGFDYLRDNMVNFREEMVQPVHNFAIVDEVDSILIDEARTPLIISGPAEESTDKYYKANEVSKKLTGRRITEGEEIDAKHKGEDLSKGFDYVADEKAKSIALTDQGEGKAAQLFGIDNLHEMETIEYRHHILQALRAKEFFKLDVDYVVRDGQVIIVDEFTGRLMPGRRWSDGLHQAIEAREGIKIERENQTLATITFQNYFRMYEKLSGMTGTAHTEASEFKEIYGLDCLVIPTNKILQRTNYPDCIYKTRKEKFDAVVAEIEELHQKGQPILVGTISIEKSELLSSMLKQRGIPHQVLNAKYHEQEAQIIAQAGRYKAVTIATNMAGRGTDIVLGGNAEYLARSLEKQKVKDVEDEGARQALYEKFYKEFKVQVEKEHNQVVEAGGLHVLGTERHESRRIDNQLRGRCGRQGDPGSSRFYVSLEDDLMRLFASDRIVAVMDRLGMEEGQVIEHPIVSRALEIAQKRVETYNFEIRKQLLDYDNVMNKQREAVYSLRRSILESDNVKTQVLEAIDETVKGITAQHLFSGQEEMSWDVESLVLYLKTKFGADLSQQQEEWKDLAQDQIEERIAQALRLVYDKKEEEIGAEQLRHIERILLLNTIDTKWKDHLYAMDQLKEGIGLRAYGQRDPKIEYQREGFAMFQMMYESINQEVAETIFKVQSMRQRQARRGIFSSLPQEMVHDEFSGLKRAPTPPSGPPQPQEERRPAQPIRKDAPKVGRNDPCPCGSGKKYKKCCGR